MVTSCQFIISRKKKYFPKDISARRVQKRGQIAEKLILE
jgi:hypothetical protein